MQAAAVTLLSLRTMTICKDILYDQDPVLEAYIIGMNSYFTYDVIVMYIGFVLTNKLQVLSFKERVLKFFRADTLIIIHHLFSQLVFAPIVFVSFLFH